MLGLAGWPTTLSWWTNLFCSGSKMFQVQKMETKTTWKFDVQNMCRVAISCALPRKCWWRPGSKAPHLIWHDLTSNDTVMTRSHHKQITPGRTLLESLPIHWQKKNNGVHKWLQIICIHLRSLHFSTTKTKWHNVMWTQHRITSLQIHTFIALEALPTLPRSLTSSTAWDFGTTFRTARRIQVN